MTRSNDNITLLCCVGKWWHMNQETQTKERLLRIAKEEFMEKGYAGASLRNICKRAEVTTGALYFFFEDKNDLFSSLVKEPMEKLHGTMIQHYDGEIKDVDLVKLAMKDMRDDKETALMIVEYMYQYHDEFVLLISKSQGSKYENCVDEFVKITEKHNRILADRISGYYNVPKLDDNTIHWLAHMEIFSFVQIITHNIRKEEALVQMNSIMNFLISGWYGIFENLKSLQQRE